MIGYNTIDELYYGNIHPAEKTFSDDSDFAASMEMYTQHEKWLRANLSDEAAEVFENLVHANDEVTDITARTYFRSGFRLGVMLMIDAVRDEEEIAL